jgi:hypothetical protein
MQAKGKKGELLKEPFKNYGRNTREFKFSLLTNSENYWNTDIKSVRSFTKFKIQRHSFSIR